MHTIQMKGGSRTDITVGITLIGEAIYSELTAMIGSLFRTIKTATSTVTEFITNLGIPAYGTIKTDHVRVYADQPEADEICLRNAIHKEVESYATIDERGAPAPT